MTRDEILLLEEMNFNAWPALRSVHLDGWLLRSSGGESRRVNSVNPLGAGRLGVSEKIGLAEAIYARWGYAAIFRVTPLADDGLDAALDERGYVVDGPTSVQCAPTKAYAVPKGMQVFWRAQDWIDAAVHVRGLSGGPAQVFAVQHLAVGVETAWVMILHDGAPAAVGAIAIERGWCGLHGIYVEKNARRLGFARQVSEALIGIAFAKGAQRAWLQVAKENAAALPLYAALGFREAFAYHHRKPRT